MPVDIAQTAAAAFTPVGIILSVLSIIVIAIIVIMNVNRKKGFFTTLYRTFFPKNYSELKDKSFSQSIGFYALFSLVFFLVVLSLGSVVISVFSSSVQYNVPELTIVQGKVWLEQDPYYVRDFVYASTKDFDPELRTEPIILTKNKLITREKDKSETRIFDLSKIQYFRLSEFAAQMQSGLFVPMLFISVILLSVFGLIFFAYNLVYFLILGAILLLNNVIFKRNLTYQQYFNLVLFSDLPVWIFILLLFWILGFVGATRFLFAYSIIHLLLLSWLTWWLSNSPAKKKAKRKAKK